MATYLDAAGPSRAPAVVIHPEDLLPKTWRIVREWTWRGQRGAWLMFTSPSAGSSRGANDAHHCQVVYRSTATRARSSAIGRWLGHASRRLICLAWSDAALRDLDNYVPPCGTWRHNADDEKARLSHLGGMTYWWELRDRDQAAIAAYFASPSATPSAPSLDKIEELGLPIRAYNSLKRYGIHTVADLLGLFDHELLRMRNMGVGSVADIDAKLAEYGLKRSPIPRATPPAAGTHTPSLARPTPEPLHRPASPPPEPGIGRAKWIGERITAMTARESSTYLPHTRRRIAAHRALSIVAGYEPQDAENDGLTLAGGFLLHLEGLNAYATRAFAGLED